MAKLRIPEGQVDPKRSYVGAKKAAEIAQVDRVRVLQWLKEGKYPGAFRNSSGYWVIPLEEAQAMERQRGPWEWKNSKRKEKKPKDPKHLEEIAGNLKKQEKLVASKRENTKIRLSTKRK